MPQFDFRIGFHLRPGDHVNSDAEELLVLRDAGGVSVRLRSGHRGTPIKDHSRLALIGGSYSSRSDARLAAERAKRALLVWAVQNRVGIDLGGRPPRGAFTDAGKHWLEERVGGPVRDDVYGIDVYEHVEGLVFVALNAEARVGKAASTFIEEIATGISSQLTLTAKQELAAEILAASYFDASERSRFVTLVSAVEALLELQSRPPEAQNLVESIKQVVRGAWVQDSTRASMLSSLEWLKKESIGQAGRALADRLLAGKTYDGKEPSRFFASCYEVRSSILHNGKAPEEVDDLLRICNVAQTFVGDLLVASFAEAD